MRVSRGADGVVREYGPVTAPAPRPLSDRCLSAEERTAIADGIRAGEGIRGIAADVGRWPSTVSRQVRRHRDPGGRHAPFAAHRMAMKELARPGLRRVQRDPELAVVVQEWLDARWSPEQVSRVAAPSLPGSAPRWHLARQAISQARYDPSVAPQRTAGQCLRTRRPPRRPRRDPNGRTARPARMRPLHVSPTAGPAGRRRGSQRGRAVGGHGEGDLITGAANRSAIGTLAERTSRYVLLVHLQGRHTTQATCSGVPVALSPLPEGRRKSLAWDQGTEMAGQESITE